MSLVVFFIIIFYKNIIIYFLFKTKFSYIDYGTLIEEWCELE